MKIFWFFISIKKVIKEPGKLNFLSEKKMNRYFKHFPLFFLVLSIWIGSVKMIKAQTALIDIKRAQLIADQNNIEFSDIYAARLIRSVISNTSNKRFFYTLDANFMNGPEVTTSSLVGFNGDFWGAMTGYQLFLFNHGDNTETGYNFFMGLNLNLRFINTTIAAGGYFSAARKDSGPLTPEEIEMYARNNSYPELSMSDLIVPYFFINSPLTSWFRAQADGQIDPLRNNDLTRLGLAAFLRALDFEVGSSYERLRVYTGDQHDAALIVRMDIQIEGKGFENLPRDFAPHIHFKYGRLFVALPGESVSSGLNNPDNTYFILEFVGGLVAGVSYRKQDGLGFRLGLKGGSDEFVTTWTLQKNYLFEDIYGIRANEWGFYCEIRYLLPQKK
jgi:hypothetical protein